MVDSMRMLPDKNRKILAQKGIIPSDNDQTDEIAQADIGKLVNQLQQQPQTMTPAGMLALQRTLGNQAVQRNTGTNPAVPARPGTTAPTTGTGTQTAPARPGTGPAVPVRPGTAAPTTGTGTQTAPARPGAAPAVPVRPGAAPSAAPDTIMPWAQFRAAIMAQAQSSLSGTSGNQQTTDNANASRKKLLDDHPLKGIYEAYDANPTLPNAVKLHNRIDHWIAMFWDHETMENAGFRNEGVQAILDATKAAVEMRIRIETAKTGADPDEAVDAVLFPAGKGKEKSRKIDFFEDVGVPYAFYSTLDKIHVKLFKNLYDALKKNKTQAVPEILAALDMAEIVGFSLIKGLFLTRFPAAAGIENFQKEGYEASRETKEKAFKANIMLGGFTEEQVEKEEYGSNMDQRRKIMQEYRGGLAMGANLTPVEMKALIEYTGGKYKESNPKLRAENLSRPEDPDQAEMASREDAYHEVIVSALNKLPPHTGLAFRMQNAWEDFDAAVKPGGVYTDLAFMSASKTIEGAEKGGASGGKDSAGALENYIMIHSKSAKMVTILSGISEETEVLFKPGTRFKVNAIWQHKNGGVPKDAPLEAQMILYRNGESKSRDVKDDMTGQSITYTGKVRVVEMTEI